jgi:type IV pilus assembly protein PilB
MSTPLRERPDAPLGTLIFRAGLLPAETIESALEEGVKTGRRLGEILIERGLLQEEDLTRLLAGQKGLPYVSLRSERIDPEAVRMLSEDQARLFTALPLRIEEGLPLIAVADPTNDVLNRNIREALGQDVRFVVTGRSELDEMIGEAYSGTLPSFAPEAQPEALVDPSPLRVDTSVPPAAEEAPPAAYEAEPETPIEVAPEPEPEPALEVAPEPALEVASEPVYEPTVHEPALEVAPEPALEVASEPVYEPTVQEPAPAYEPEPVPAYAPEPAPELEPVAAYEEPTVTQSYDAPPLPTYEEPVAREPEPEPVVPLATEPVAPQTVPETNGQVPHDFEDDLLPAEPSEPLVPVEEAQAVAAAPEPAPAEAAAGGYTVSIRLTSGERLIVSESADLGEAKGYAKALTKQLGATDPDDWPFVNGRFLKPDTIVSVDVESA